MCLVKYIKKSFLLDEYEFTGRKIMMCAPLRALLRSYDQRCPIVPHGRWDKRSSPVTGGSPKGAYVPFEDPRGGWDVSFDILKERNKL